ncbi:MAG: histidine kinase [Flavobacteriaceae bacterium]|nr:MAG: histidine kinase [Flavobacteriaceae bacterium]
MVDQYFFKNKKVLFYIFNLSLIIGIFFLVKYSLKLIVFSPTMNGVRLREVRSTMVSSIQLILPMILSIGMCVGLKINKKWNKNELLLQKVKQAQLDAEIKYLRYQIQPHFLFNTLNNIYSLIDSAPNSAKTSIHSLSKMMRYLLHESIGNKVPLVKEIDFMERYIDLMQLRVSSNLSLEKSFPIVNQPIQIAPLLLISFIENAFKHGIDALQPSHIKIALVIEKEKLHYSVINSSFPQKEKVTDSGIGLENLKKRLELLYPNRFELINMENDNIYTAKLTLNFK